MESNFDNVINCLTLMFNPKPLMENNFDNVCFQCNLMPLEFTSVILILMDCLGISIGSPSISLILCWTTYIVNIMFLIFVNDNNPESGLV